MNQHDICDSLAKSQMFIFDCATAARQNGADTMQAIIVKDKLILTFQPPQYTVIDNHTLTQPANVKQLPNSIGDQLIETYHYDLIDDTQIMLEEVDKLIDELTNDVWLIHSIP